MSLHIFYEYHLHFYLALPATEFRTISDISPEIILPTQTQSESYLEFGL